MGSFFDRGSYYFYLNVDPIGKPTDYPVLSVPVVSGDALRSTLVIKVPEALVAQETAAARNTVWSICILFSLLLAPAVWLGLKAMDRREQALKEARAAERAKAELLTDASLAPEYHDYAATIRNTGESLVRVIDDILDFSRIEAGQMHMERRHFSVASAVKDGNEATHQIRLIERQNGQEGSCYIVALSASVVPSERDL